ncbi:lipopolysaccharide biosynthesis protein [bacterium]|nr:lipopolysaccharide biosynthesis protein [bacterium]
MFSKEKIANNLLKNFSSGVGAQVFTVACNFFAVPFLLKRFGVEAYGLVAFYSTLQVVFTILDGGISPLLIRQTAASLGGGEKVEKEYSALLQACISFCCITALAGGVTIFMAADFLGTSWLEFNEMDTEQVVLVIQTMAIIIGLRWLSGFYRAMFVGHQNITLLSAVNIFMAVFRFLLVLLYLTWISGGVLDYFKYQLFCGLLELSLLFFLNSKFNKHKYWKTTFHEKIAAVKNNYKFALYAGIGSVIWIVLTQTDKVIVSKSLEISDFSAFSLGVLGASIFFFISTPLSNVFIPKLTEIYKLQNTAAFHNLYSVGLNLCAIVLIPITILVYIFSTELLLFWTGNIEVSEKADLVLGLYSLGNGIAVLGSFAYFLQSAIGNLKLHLLGSVIFLVLFVPALFTCLNVFGINGAGIVWLAVHLIMFFCWGGYIHSVYLKKFYLKWITKVFIPVTLFSFILALIEYYIYSLTSSKYLQIILLPVSSIANLGLLYVYVYGFRRIQLPKLMN